MTGWIVYEEADALKNQEYINMFITAAAKYNVSLQLQYLQSDIDTPESIILPDFVINRSRNTAFAKWMESHLVRVFNPAIVTDICNNKRLTYEFVKKHNIPIPDTVYTIEKAASLSFPLVVKPACGHGGDCVTLVHNEHELQSATAAIQKRYSAHSDMIFQHCVSDIGKDLRIYVLGGKILAAVMRTAYDTNDSIPSLSAPSVDIRSNYSLGHKATLHSLTDEEMTLVNRIIPLLPFDCIGIDFIYEKGHPIFNEIEDAVGARMLYANSEIDIVNEYMQLIMNCTR